LYTALTKWYLSPGSDSGFDLQSLPSDIIENLRFKLRLDLKSITNHYGSYADYIRTSIIKQGVTAKQLIAVLMGYTCFSHSKQEEVRILFSRKIIEAVEVNDIVIELHREYASFLNYEIFQTLQEKYVIDNGEEVLRYPERLKAYIEKLNIAEFIEVRPALRRKTKQSKKIALKMDIAATSKLSGLRDLRYKLAEILGIHLVELQLHDVEEGCVIVTFLILNTAVDSIFTGNKHEIFTQKQVVNFQALKIMWLRCGLYTWHFSRVQDDNVDSKFIQGESNSMGKGKGFLYCVCHVLVPLLSLTVLQHALLINWLSCMLIT
jgi:hypothetical protein